MINHNNLQTIPNISSTSKQHQLQTRTIQNLSINNKSNPNLKNIIPINSIQYSSSQIQNQLTQFAYLFVKIYKLKVQKSQNLMKKLQKLKKQQDVQISDQQQQDDKFEQEILNKELQDIESRNDQLCKQQYLVGQYIKFLNDRIKGYNSGISGINSTSKILISQKNLGYQQVEDLLIQNAIQQLRAIKKKQKIATDRFAIQQSKLQKQIHELRAAIKQKQDNLKQLNKQIFVQHINHNKKLKTKHSIIGKHQSVTNLSHNYIKHYNSQSYTSNKTKSTHKIIIKGLKKTPQHQFGFKHNTFIGLKNFKQQSLLKKDTQILKQYSDIYLKFIKFFVSDDQIGFQCFYGRFSSKSQQQGIIQSWTDQSLITQSLHLPLVVPIQQLYSIWIYYDKKIKAVQLIFKNQAYKILGDRKQKYQKEQFILANRLLKYLASYWRNSEMIGISIGYTKSDYSNTGNESRQFISNRIGNGRREIKLIQKFRGSSWNRQKTSGIRKQKKIKNEILPYEEYYI